MLFLPAIWLACSTGVSLRLIGPLFLVAPVGVCMIYAVLRRSAPPKILSAYLAYCVLIAILSFYRVMPTSWQVHFLPDAIIRQMIPVLGFFSVAWASKAYFSRRLGAGNPFYAAPAFLFLCLVIAPIVMFLQDRQYQGQSVEASVLGLYGALINNVMIGVLFLTRSAFLQKGARRCAALALILLIGLTTHFIQFRILTLALIAILLTRKGHLVILVVAAAVLSTYLIAFNFIPEIMRDSPNSGLRLTLLSDAIRSTIDTNGLGIGYGTESVRWRYFFPGMPVFTFLPDANTMNHERLLSALSTGVENSFVQSMLRTGFIGFVLFVAAFFVLVPSPRLPRPLRNHAAAVFIMLAIACFVNSSLESPLAVVGAGFCYGYLVALKRAACMLPAPFAKRVPMFTGLIMEAKQTRFLPTARFQASPPALG